jgi:hypothetical protein
MPLPKLVVPEYELELPSSKETVKYRPFLVKEEKLLLTAMQLGEEKDMMNAVKTIIKNCTNLKSRVEELSTFDIEYVFLKIRSKSVGEVSKVMVTCPDDGETEVEVEIDLEEIEVKFPADHTNKIELTDDVGVIMKYPSLDTFIKLNFAGEDITVENMFDLSVQCMSQIYEGEDIHDCRTYSKKELMDFLESLKSDQFQKLQNFFMTMPKLEHDIEIENPKTKVKSTVKLEGLGSFFA